MKTNSADAPIVRADADPTTGGTANEKLDRILNGLGALTTRLDSVEAKEKEKEEKESKKDADVKGMMDAVMKKVDACMERMDAMDKSRKDSEKEEEEEKKAKKDAEEKSEKEKADKARKDAEEKEAEEKKRADAARAGATDPTIKARLDDLDKRLTELPPAERAKFIGAQMKAERVAQAFGDSAGAPRWLNGEAFADYQRRLLGTYKQHSAAWKDKDLAIVHDSVLDIAETQIYADAVAAASSPSVIGAGVLRESVDTDRTGRKITRFTGDPEACWGAFKHARRAVSGMSPPRRVQ